MEDRRAVKRKKKTIEEIRAYNRERQRKTRKKLTEEQLQAKREYNRKYMRQKKEKGLLKKVADMTPTEARKVRHQTKERTRRYREKKKLADQINPPPNTSLDKRGSSRREVCRKKTNLSQTKV